MVWSSETGQNVYILNNKGTATSGTKLKGTRQVARLIKGTVSQLVKQLNTGHM